MEHRIGRRVPAWAGYLGAVVLVSGLYYLLPMLGSAGPLLQVVTYGTVSWSPVLAVAVGVARYAPARRAPWVLLAAGQLSTAIGEVIFDVQHQILHVQADVSAADPFYLASYPLQAWGLLLLVRSRTPGRQTASLIDASIIAIGAGLLSWMFLISPAAFASDATPLARLVSAAYPVMDLLLLVVTARLALGGGGRSPAFVLLVGSMALLLGADTVYGIQNLLGVYQDGNFLDAFWMVGAAALGAAALHPSMGSLAEPTPTAGPQVSTARLVVLAVAALLAPAALLVQDLRGQPLYVPLVVLCCMVLFLLVIARMAGLARVQRRMAITDALTGLRTRRFFDEFLAGQLDRVGRRDVRVGLLLLDVDHFKRINDRYGHQAGDVVLREVARRLGSLVRANDVVARYGGEEFAVLLPGAGLDDVAAVGERARIAIAAEPVTVDGQTSIPVTVSVGAAALPEHAMAADTLTRAADQALYAAKESGRNRLVRASAS